MKRIFAFILCVILICALPLVAYAEESEAAVTEGVSTEQSLEKVQTTISEKIVAWILPHMEEISVVITLILSSFYQMRKHSLLNKSMGVMNNNTIAVAENSASSMQQALAGMADVSTTLTEYKETINGLLAEYKQTAEEKKVLEAKLTEVESYLKSAKDSNIEFSNELAELLVLANIPNAKKDELYSRHRAAVEAIEAAAKVEAKDEVKEDEGTDET